MVKVVLCGNITMREGDASSALHQCARMLGIDSLNVTEFSNPTDLIAACLDIAVEDPFDLVISAYDLPGVTGLQMARELQSTHALFGTPRVVLCAIERSIAFEAYSCGVDGFLLEPVASEDFTDAISRLLSEILRDHAESIVVHCKDGAHRVLFSQLEYVSTSGHDQEIHMRGVAEPCVVRGSSNAVFALLESDGRFYKVGSSYIVNMDLVRSCSLRSGVVTLVSGTQVPVPVRARKALGEALCARSAITL